MSQETRILSHLKSGKSITPIEGLNRFKCFRLASRINKLKKLGHNIKTTMVSKGKKRFAQYKLFK